MLVDVRQDVKQPERQKSVGLVWLHRLDCLLCREGYIRNPSTLTWPLLRRRGDGKLRGLLSFDPVLNRDEKKRDVVKHGAAVVQAFADKDADRIGKRRPLLRGAVNMLIPTLLDLSDGGVRIAFEQSLGDLIESVQVFEDPCVFPGDRFRGIWLSRRSDHDGPSGRNGGVAGDPIEPVRGIPSTRPTRGTDAGSLGYRVSTGRRVAYPDQQERVSPNPPRGAPPGGRVRLWTRLGSSPHESGSFFVRSVRGQIGRGGVAGRL